MIWFEASGVPRQPAFARVAAPFARLSHLQCAVALLVVLGLSPIVVTRWIPIDPVALYKGVPAIYGNYYTIGSELDKPGDIDVLIVGASDAWTSLDPRIIRAYLERKTGRSVRVLNVGTNWAGEERNAQVIADFVRTRKVKLVLVPENDSAMNAPHELAKYWWRGDISTEGLPWVNRAQLHFMAIVGLPRQLWARYRTEQNTPLTESYQNYLREQTSVLGFNAAKTGWKSHSEPNEAKRRPFVDRPAPPPSATGEDLFYRPGSGQGFFEARSYDYTAYQTHFTLKARDIVRAHGGVFATFSIPTHFQGAPLEKAWFRQHKGQDRDWPMIGISMTRLFPGLTFDQMVEFYGNESHLNEAGAKAYTHSLLPAIEKLYEQAANG